MSEALLLAIGGILGISLGRLWDIRSETLRWHRDQKTACYQRLAEAFILIYEDIRSIALTDPDTDESANAIDRARRDKTWDNALASVWLHGSTPVVAAASLMDRVLTELFYDAQARVFSVEQWNTARTPSASAFEGFISAARKELNLSAAPITLFPYTPS
ncbi:hypothetical protein [Actinomadura sp. 3N508]|uniref:hypothetical protein n=1 Tax=Actinomadura sp. 3N508 TaxID=3375153 RepID=UPI003792A9FE